MPAFNATRFIDASIASILCQTLADFELIVVDDGSLDGTSQRVRAHQAADPRIRLVAQAQTGVAAALNTGCLLARGRFIARMDADDLAAPDRLQRQFRFLEMHPDITILGSAIMLIDTAGVRMGMRRFPTKPDVIARTLRAGSNPIAHPSVMVRREALCVSGGYDSRFEGSEDYELWLRMLGRFRFANLRAPLLHYRVHAASASTAGRLRQALVGRAACALHRAGAVPGTTTPTIRWANLDRLGLSERERAQLAIAVASVALRQLSQPDPRDQAELAEATAALSIVASASQPRDLAEAALAMVVSARLRDPRAAELMASMARILAHKSRLRGAAYWIARAASTHPGGVPALAFLMAGFIGRRLRHLTLFP